MTKLFNSLAGLALVAALAFAPMSSAWASAGGFGTKLYAAKIHDDGSHVAGTGGMGLVSSSKLGTGIYSVEFVGARERCYPIVTLGRGDTTASSRGFINVVDLAVNSRAYYIRTTDPSGTLTDRSFHILVYCSQ